MNELEACSAAQVAAIEKEWNKRKEIETREKEEQKLLSLTAVLELQKQNQLLQKEHDEQAIELKKAKKQNLLMAIVSVLSALVAIASLIVAIIK